MNDYLEVEYDVKRKPLTKYPRKLAYHIINLFDLKPGDKILEIGSGRCEILQHFAEFGLKTYAIDSAPSAQEYANKIGSSFEILEISSEKEIEPFDGQKFDFIYSKSFVEHISDPLDFGLKCKNILNSNGKFIVLTPDFESNYKIFYDLEPHHDKQISWDSVSPRCSRRRNSSRGSSSVRR